jgi:hypothetical protein
MFECLICGEDMREVVMDHQGRWQPDDEVNCGECWALHRVESDPNHAWLVLLKSGSEYIEDERTRLRQLLRRAARYLEHLPTCRIDRMPMCRCTCGETETQHLIELELQAFLADKMAGGRSHRRELKVG